MIILSQVFFCEDGLPDAAFFFSLYRPWPSGHRWTPSDFRDLTQLCNYENVGCYCEEPRLWWLFDGRPKLNCRFPVRGRQELNQGMSDIPVASSASAPMRGTRVPGFRSFCEQRCFCQRTRPEFVAPMIDAMGAKREDRQEAWLGSVRLPSLIPGQPARDRGHPSYRKKGRVGNDALDPLAMGSPPPPAEQTSRQPPPAAVVPSSGPGADGERTCPLSACWRPGSCSTTSRCSCFVPQRRPSTARVQSPPNPNLRSPQVSQPRLRAVCGMPKLASKRDVSSDTETNAIEYAPSHQPPIDEARRGAIDVPQTAPPLASRRDLTLQDNHGLPCPCNCSYVSAECCTPEAVANDGIINLSSAASVGVIDPGESMCCNGQTGDLQALLPGQTLIGNSTLCP